MKIGILTFHNADNYGAVLQCYALQESLKKLFPNDEVCAADYRNNEIEKSYRILSIRKKLRANITQFLYIPAALGKRNQFKKFRERFLSLGSSDITKYDMIFYGSDQIWNPVLTAGDLSYFGNGFDGVKIAYGASDGGEIKEQEIKELLLKFKGISCREKTLAEKISCMTARKDIKAVCDPVFLLSKNAWLAIAKAPKQNGYILAYKIADNLNFDSEVEKTAIRLEKKVIQIVYLKSLRKLFCRKQHFVKGISVEEFLGYVANADLVITTSFHATAFSLIFERPFYVLKLEIRSERITDLLNSIQLEERYVEKIPEKITGCEIYSTEVKENFKTHCSGGKRFLSEVLNV
ncbi:polysaccharide pyruvyl transferase family protein [Treponema brennaborense]|uniref:Polysaccharide pyruvyl transferase domain-containing protein n=1 Tax=Treponema brennaborense (strain DSM 12168 / CIP 105900 / DD5/3) TaxID=906968 RepID=F4LPZ8_TREBD|nr:polysaccharide pyruvyl transferase family protein [Treponema brennaborense]AEE17076.1 hypothetical protein Trebr_1654 [Treponema brennaborense DSM 12168]